MTETEKQIVTLLSGNPLKFACEKLGVRDMSKHSYSQVFTVTRSEVYEYVRKYGIPQNYSNSRNSLTDGFKFFEEDGKWYCCFRERGICFDEKELDNYDTGLIYITDMLLRLSGTGIY